MNERIKELADKATSYCDTLDIADQTIYQDIWKREFAVLFVGKCADIADEYDGVGSTIVGRIKKHFGIEE